MAEPAISLGEWFSAAVASLLAGIGGAMGWLAKYKRDVYGRVNEIEQKMEGHILGTTERHGEHQTKLAVLETCQQNTANQLEQMNATTAMMNQKLDRLIDKFVDPKG